MGPEKRLDVGERLGVVETLEGLRGPLDQHPELRDEGAVEFAFDGPHPGAL